MKKPVIEVRGISKRYRIGSVHSGRFTTLRDHVASWFQWRTAEAAKTDLEFWALRNVTFDVQPGEVLGIIGANGAGKSTLLKILSRITEPTEGDVILRGRVASLLEVGTGFHPELTGRENIFLNGVVLGMRRVEIARRFDEIVAFSGVEKFLDTPVKRYSSGMYVRLAFSVAAHLSPEVLIVDEVLAVGDLAFQQRCMSKMQDISQNEGQAILLVSHNLAAIRRLCSRVMVIDRGEIQFLGCPETACRSYLEKNFPLQSTRRWDDLDAPGDGVVSLVSLGCLNSEGVPTEGVDVTDPVRVAMQFRVHTGGHILVPNFHFYTLEGSCLFVVQDLDPEWRGRVRNPGLYTCEAFIPGNFLSEGGIVIGVAVTTMQPFHVHFVLQEAIRLEVGDRGSHDSARGDFTGDLPGAVRPLLKTQTRFTADSKPAGEHCPDRHQHSVLPEEL